MNMLDAFYVNDQPETRFLSAQATSFSSFSQIPSPLSKKTKAAAAYLGSSTEFTTLKNAVVDATQDHRVAAGVGEDGVDNTVSGYDDAFIDTQINDKQARPKDQS